MKHHNNVTDHHTQTHLGGPGNRWVNKQRGKHMTTTRTLLRRLAAGTGAVALALAGIVAGASTASAAPGPGQPGAGTSGSLTVHKHAGSTTGNPNNGTVQTIDRPPLGGVPFTLTQRGTLVGSVCTALDLTTAAGWSQAQAIIGGATSCTVGTARTLSTGPNGAAVFSSLALGLYHVTEGSVAFVETPAAPFYVTIPYRSDLTSAEGWLYDVHVYPKNTITAASAKTVSAPLTHGLGSAVTWTIDTRPLGSFNEGKPLGSYAILDNLGTDLTYKAASAKLTMSLPTGATGTIPAYTITEPPAGAGGTVKATFTGLAALNALPAGTRFQLTFDTFVTGAGSTVNEAFETTGADASHQIRIGTASSQWGVAQILKHHAGKVDQPLQGAKFSVRDAAADGTCVGTLGAVVAVSGATEFASGADGIVTIAGLWVGTGEQTASRTYCAVEVSPPAGYILDSTPRAIVVKAEKVATGTASIQVANTPTPGPVLPLTGAEGTTMFTFAGLALVAIAGGGFLVRRARVNH